MGSGPNRRSAPGCHPHAAGCRKWGHSPQGLSEVKRLEMDWLSDSTTTVGYADARWQVDERTANQLKHLEELIACVTTEPESIYYTFYLIKYVNNNINDWMQMQISLFLIICLLLCFFILFIFYFLFYRENKLTFDQLNFCETSSFMPKYGNFANGPVSRKPLSVERK